MLKKILLGGAAIFALLLIGFVAVAAMQPAEVHISRSLAMAAPADKVFEQVNDLHKSPDWSPFIKLDPNIKYSYEGPGVGEGAVYKWSGNDEVGEGSMTIVESKPNELVRMKLQFIRPMQDTAEAVFTFKPVGDKIDVTWAMNGTNSFMEKAVCLFMDLDQMIGDKFLEGLTDMKKIVEAPPAAAGAITHPESPAATSP
jgi:hypothetical protein